MRRCKKTWREAWLTLTLIRSFEIVDCKVCSLSECLGPAWRGEFCLLVGWTAVGSVGIARWHRFICVNQECLPAEFACSTGRCIGSLTRLARLPHCSVGSLPHTRSLLADALARRFFVRSWVRWRVGWCKCALRLLWSAGRRRLAGGLDTSLRR